MNFFRQNDKEFRILRYKRIRGFNSHMSTKMEQMTGHHKSSFLKVTYEVTPPTYRLWTISTVLFWKIFNTLGQAIIHLDLLCLSPPQYFESSVAFGATFTNITLFINIVDLGCLDQCKYQFQVCWAFFKSPLCYIFVRSTHILSTSKMTYLIHFATNPFISLLQ